eukprot:8678994-Lingulodinium_polyedra.AAC.1
MPRTATLRVLLPHRPVHGQRRMLQTARPLPDTGSKLHPWLPRGRTAARSCQNTCKHAAVALTAKFPSHAETPD